MCRQLYQKWFDAVKEEITFDKHWVDHNGVICLHNIVKGPHSATISEDQVVKANLFDRYKVIILGTKHGIMALCSVDFAGHAVKCETSFDMEPRPHYGYIDTQTLIHIMRGTQPEFPA